MVLTDAISYVYDYVSGCLRKSEVVHEREKRNQTQMACYIYFSVKGMWQVLPSQRWFRVVSCCVELPHCKAGKGEGKCPDVCPQWGYSTSIHNVALQRGFTLCILIVSTQQVDAHRLVCGGPS
jgi:hypothetical protein